MSAVANLAGQHEGDRARQQQSDDEDADDEIAGREETGVRFCGRLLAEFLVPLDEVENLI